jgi:hypothetical protein
MEQLAMNTEIIAKGLKKARKHGFIMGLVFGILLGIAIGYGIAYNTIEWTVIIPLQKGVEV